MERNHKAEVILATTIGIFFAYLIFERGMPFSADSRHKETQAGWQDSTTSEHAGTGHLGEYANYCQFARGSVQSNDRNGFGIPVEWSSSQVGDGYTLNEGRYKDWLVALELQKDGQVLFRDYTPPGQTILYADTQTGKHGDFIRNTDGYIQLGLFHEPAEGADKTWHDYGVYELRPLGVTLKN